jgi:hypothetical protein
VVNQRHWQSLFVAFSLILFPLVSAAQGSSPNLVSPGVYVEITSHAPAGAIPHEWK